MTTLSETMRLELWEKNKEYLTTAIIGMRHAYKNIRRLGLRCLVLAGSAAEEERRFSQALKKITLLLTSDCVFAQFIVLVPVIMALRVLDYEARALDEFRDCVKDLECDETTLVRFLRARNLNVEKAEQMIRKSVEWRANHEIDSVRKFEIPTAMAKDFKLYYSGSDAEGRPVYVVPMGRWDGRKILGMGYKEEACRFMYKVLEVIMDKCKDSGVTQFHTIIDYSGLSFWKVAHWDSLECVLRVTRDFEANYPETLYRAHFVNAPSVFWQAFKAVKPLLGQATVDKIQIFDSDKKRWQEHLLSYVPKESLISDYGGTAMATDFFPTYAGC